MRLCDRGERPAPAVLPIKVCHNLADAGHRQRSVGQGILNVIVVHGFTQRAHLRMFLLHVGDLRS